MVATGIDRRAFLALSGALAGALGACARPGERSPHEASAPRAPRIDGHQHFWTYDAERYSWLDPASPVARDFGPADLEPALAAAHIEGSVLVEACSRIDETEALLQHARRTPFVRGAVGWLPLTDPGVSELIARYAADPKPRGLRHALAAEPNPDYMFRPDFNAGLARLAPAGLRFDLLLVPHLLGRAPRVVDAHPQQIFILDHFAKPFIARRELEPWAKELRVLAERPNVYAKVSGLVTEADPARWSASDLRPYLDLALEAFTPRRLLFGSDWPMCLFATSYAGWLETLETWASALSPDERARLFGATAVEAYGLATAPA